MDPAPVPESSSRHPSVVGSVNHQRTPGSSDEGRATGEGTRRPPWWRGDSRKESLDPYRSRPHSFGKSGRRGSETVKSMGEG